MSDTGATPKKEGKTLRLASAIFMIAAWLMMLALLAYWFVIWPRLTLFLHIWFGLLFVLILVPLVLIPIQVVRYFRKNRP